MGGGYSAREVADRLAIRDVLTRYFLGLDHQDKAMVASCFAPDIEAVISGNVLPPGREAVIGYMFGDASRPAAQSKVVHRMHFMGQIHIILEGDEAQTETYAYAHLTAERDGGLVMRRRGLRYLDSLRRVDGAWLIYRRRHTAEFEVHETPEFVSENIATRVV